MPLDRNYERNVFVNCPFDDEYTPLFEAMIFTILDCGFRPLCARARMNSAELRLDKILDMIRDSRFSIHDLSRTALDARSSLPRFNMPFELGIALGCSRFGAGKQRLKSIMVLDARRHRYQRFISDIAGQDISEHRNSVPRIITVVRDWLRTESGVEMPGAEFIVQHYRAFRRAIDRFAGSVRLNAERLTYADYCFTISEWLAQTRAER